MLPLEQKPALLRDSKPFAAEAHRAFARLSNAQRQELCDHAQRSRGPMTREDGELLVTYSLRHVAGHLQKHQQRMDDVSAEALCSLARQVLGRMWHEHSPEVAEGTRAAALARRRAAEQAEGTPSR
jgi:hypothetical protein